MRITEIAIGPASARNAAAPLAKLRWLLVLVRPFLLAVDGWRGLLLPALGVGMSFVYRVAVSLP